MSLDRRSLLRAAMQTAAAGALVAGCADNRPRTASSPASPRSGAPTARPPGAPGGGPAPLPAGLPDQIVHGPRDRAMVALTFHGQGDPKLAEALLGEAEGAGARITVLAVGSWLDACPRMAHRILDGGHELGNHTQNHLGISSMPEDRAAAEITGCADRLRRLTGGIGRWFRPSQTQYATPRVLRLARAAGYPHVLSYDVDSLDYTDPGADAVRGTVLERAGHGSVVSLHFGHAGTVEALPALLDGLKQRGLRAVTTSELLT